MLWRRFATYISQEVFVAIKPTFTNFDSSAAIAVIVGSIRVNAALNQTGPRRIFRSFFTQSSSVAVNNMLSSKLPVFTATATAFCVAGAQEIGSSRGEI